MHEFRHTPSTEHAFKLIIQTQTTQIDTRWWYPTNHTHSLNEHVRIPQYATCHFKTLHNDTQYTRTQLKHWTTTHWPIVHILHSWSLQHPLNG